jgi:L-fuculose-phosphate aldolase
MIIPWKKVSGLTGKVFNNGLYLNRPMDVSIKYKDECREVARFMKRLYRNGLTTTSGGNISLRLHGEKIAITPSATDKGHMKWKEVGILTISGKNLTPHLKPSIETEMHLSIYRRTNAKAIVHAHPVFATTFTAMDREINTSLIAESVAILGKPTFVPYALMGTRELADMVAGNIGKSDILLLENHGVLSIGTSLLQAFDKIEVLENAARMTVITEIMGSIKSLSGKRIDEIEKLFR